MAVISPQRSAKPRPDTFFAVIASADAVISYAKSSDPASYNWWNYVRVGSYLVPGVIHVHVSRNPGN
jgi:hypothetical protein